MAGRIYKADLHVHTCLSPCGDISMSPQEIVRAAVEHELDIIAISDHNTVANVPGVMDAAKGTSLTVLPAMEITSREEVHILSIFPTLEVARAVESQTLEMLNDSDDESYVEDQIIVNGDDEVEGFCSKLLITATKLSVRKTVELVHSVGGIAIAAHIDRQAFGILGQLGFIPPKVKFDALEISWRQSLADAPLNYPDQSDYTFITNSDAHFLKDLGRTYTQYFMMQPEFSELAAALSRSNDRHVEVVTS